MSQLPPVPDADPAQSPQPSEPGQPTEAPAEQPATTPDVDVPAPSSPGTDAPTTPISPVG